MGHLLAYSFVSGLILLAMYLVYKLFMASENQHTFNRVVILAIYAVSFLAWPFAGILKTYIMSGPALPTGPVLVAGDISLMNLSSPLWSRIVLWIYLLGIVSVAMLTFITWFRILAIIRKGEKIRCKDHTLVLTDNDSLAPFSWMNYMVINRNDFERCGDIISEHELRHIRCMHRVDLLVAQAVVTVNWFNPAAWLLRDELMLVHEYQADMAVIESGYNPKEYQLLLIKKAVGARFQSLANSLNHSKLKKRITMMYRSKSRSGARLKVLALAPAVALALLLTTVPQLQAAITTISGSGIVDSKVSENSADNENAEEIFVLKNVSDHGGKTTVTVGAIIPGQTLTVGDATLFSGGKAFISESVSTSMTNSDATIILTFPYLESFDDLSLVLNANGKNIRMNLQPYFSGEDVSAIQSSDDDSQAAMEEPLYFVDGNKVTKEYLYSISPDDIESITVDKANSVTSILVSLKK